MLSFLASRRQPTTHAQRLERWLGTEQVEQISTTMRKGGGFPHPIAVHGVPGAVWATGDGDFIGEIRAGQEMSALDRAVDRARRLRRRLIARHGRDRHALGAFSNLSSVIAAATGGKAQYPVFQKVGQAAVAVGNCIDLWSVGNQPAAGSGGAAAPGGTATTNSTQGALKWANPTNANTGHFVTGNVTASVVANTLLLIDQLFRVLKTASSTATEAVTGTFSRYQSGTATNEDYIGGNFCYPSVLGTTMANTAHNWTVCQYTDQDGNTAQSFASTAGIASATSSIRHIDLAAGNWFLPLASGDVGVKALTQMQNSASMTGVLDFVVSHPIAFMPCPVANMICVLDGINTAFNFTRIYDNACLNLLEMPKPATTATTYSGNLQLVAE